MHTIIPVLVDNQENVINVMSDLLFVYTKKNILLRVNKNILLRVGTVSQC